MKPEEAYAAWLRARRKADVPAGFADRVMNAVRAEPVRPSGLSALVAAIGRSASARVAMILLAALACAFRLAGSLALLFVS